MGDERPFRRAQLAQYGALRVADLREGDVLVMSEWPTEPITIIARRSILVAAGKRFELELESSARSVKRTVNANQRVAISALNPNA